MRAAWEWATLFTKVVALAFTAEKNTATTVIRVATFGAKKGAGAALADWRMTILRSFVKGIARGTEIFAGKIFAIECRCAWCRGFTR